MFSPLTPKIWLVILPSSCKHISLQVSYKNLMLDPDNNLYLRSLIILINYLCAC